MMPKKHIFWLGMFLVIGLVLRLNNLAGRSLWIDDFFTRDIKVLLDDISRQERPELFTAADFRRFLENDPARGIRDVNEGLVSNDTHPPFYFYLMHFWMKAFGDGVFAARFFSLLSGLICVFLAYKVTQRLFNMQAALLSGIFTSICAFSVRFSQEARQYSLVMALGLLAWLLLLRLEKHHKIADAMGFAVRMQFGPAPKNISLWINQESTHRTPAVIAYNTRAVIFPQSYYLEGDTYLIPVSSRQQLRAAVSGLPRQVDALFIVRYFHRTDTRLTDNSFMETGDIGFGFKLKGIFYKDDIKVAEYIKCAS